MRSFFARLTTAENALTDMREILRRLVANLTALDRAANAQEAEETNRDMLSYARRFVGKQVIITSQSEDDASFGIMVQCGTQTLYSVGPKKDGNGKLVSDHSIPLKTAFVVLNTGKIINLTKDTEIILGDRRAK